MMSPERIDKRQSTVTSPEGETVWRDDGSPLTGGLPPSGLDPLRFQTPRYATIVVDLLRDLILNGTYKSGERLNEVALSEQLQISRSPIRKALRALGGEGLVTMVANHGAYVQTYTDTMLSELAVVRESLECTAVRLAAVSMTTTQLASAQDMANKIDRLIHANPHSHVQPPKGDFHSTIADGSNNAELAAMIKNLESKFMVARARSRANPERAQASRQEHLEILQAVLDRDADAAARLMSVHLENSLASMRKTLAD